MKTTYKKGDKFVASDPSHADNTVFEVDRIGRDGEVYDTKWRKLNLKHMRPATSKEIQANTRLP